MAAVLKFAPYVLEKNGISVPPPPKVTLNGALVIIN
tara:strand:- start:806 stop:913 length:108 start_codon:yes stop_codon:yes gene_type:complete